MAESVLKLRCFVYKSSYFSFIRGLFTQRISYHVASAKSKSIEECFLNQNVQQILKKITGLDYQKLFQPVKQKLTPPEYKFVTDKELQQLRTEAEEKALRKLAMPPVMSERKPIGEVIAKNPELQGYETHKVVFTDISPSFNDKSRTIVVREPNGILREADWGERFRMNQVYFPKPHRRMTASKMFEEKHLLEVLRQKSYLFVLDRACIQYEPDDPEYIRVTHTTYDFISQKKDFDILRSTRHFGTMAFYLAFNNKAENLMIDMLERKLLSDAADLAKLVYLLQSENLQIDVPHEENYLDFVRDFISKTDSAYKPSLELAFQTYCEIHENREMLQSST